MGTRASWALLLLVFSVAGRSEAASEAIELDYPHPVNIAYSGPQGPSSICTQPDGTTVVVWMDGDYGATGRDGSGTSIQMRRLSPTGTLEVQTTVNTITADYQVDPQVTCASNGDFVVVWESGLLTDGPDGSGSAIAARRFLADGTPKGAEFVVNSTAYGNQSYPDACGFPDGGFVAVWADDDGYIWGRRFDASGTAVATDFAVDFSSYDLSSDPAVGCASDGSFVAIWASEQNTGDVLFQRFDSAGLPAGAMTTANENTDGEQGVFYSTLDDPADVSVAPDGRFVIAWTDYPFDGDEKVMVRRFAVDGTAQGPSIEASYIEFPTDPLFYDVSAAIGADGGFGVTYNQVNGIFDLKSQVARLFHADGTAAGRPVDYGRGGFDSYSDYPVISALSGGVFAVSWSMSLYGRDDSWDIDVNWVGGSMCGTAPATSCRVTPAGGGKLQARNANGSTHDKIKWSWKKGAQTLIGALGDPLTGHSRYEFCLYDASAAPQPLVDALVPPHSGSPYPPEWRGGSSGFKFAAKIGSYEGYATKMGAKAGEAGRSSVQVQTEGFEMDGMLPLSGSVVAQLLVHGNDGIECWQTTFSSLETNDGSKVTAVGP